MTHDALFIPRWRLRDRTTRLALLLLAAMGAAYLAYLMVLLDRMTLSVPPIHSDFHALWSYARIAMQDGALAVYDPSHLAQAEIVLGRDPLRPAPLPFAFPPPFLLLIWPLGWFGYATGYAVWSCGTLALLLAALPRGRLLVLLAPAAAATIYFGQSGFLFAALLVGGLRLTMRAIEARRAPRAAPAEPKHTHIFLERWFWPGNQRVGGQSPGPSPPGNALRSPWPLPANRRGEVTPTAAFARTVS